MQVVGAGRSPCAGRACCSSPPLWLPAIWAQSAPGALTPLAPGGTPSGSPPPAAGPSPPAVTTPSGLETPRTPTGAQAVQAEPPKKPQPVPAFPTECLTPQNLDEMYACARALEAVSPTLAGDVRQALGSGDFQRAQDLIERVKREQGLVPEATATQQPVKIPESPFSRLLAPERSPALSEAALDLKPFGYNLFQAGAAVPPPGQVPVGADYLLGPEDEVVVTVWGQLDGVYRARVNREGEVVFPRIGAVPVAGLAFGEAKTLLAKLFTQQFRNVSVSVAMGQLRSIQIFVVGEVQKPGSYQLSSLSTVLTALFACGGPTATGSLRQIQVLRRGQVVAKVDLYDFLLKGDKSQDIRLQDQDVVFVPLVGPVVGVAGHVLRPAIYEVRPGATLGEVLALAGGVRPTGYLARVQIERIVAHDKRVVIDLNLAPSQGAEPATAPDAKPSLVAERTPIHNMDMVKVFPISPLPQQVVILKGHVVRPGAYELKPGMRVKDVVKGLEELLPEAFLDYARILRYAGPERAKNVVAFNLRRALDGEPSANLELENLDEIEIFSKEEVKALPSVSVVGEVRKPGTYPLLAGMRVSDLIMMAGGLRKVAYTPQADLTRYEVVGSKTTVQLLTVDLERALAGDPSHDLLLRELDRLAVRPIPESEVGRTVMVLGEVKRPGEYAIRRGERVSSVLKRAGGFTERAFPRGLILIRESAKQAQQSEVQKFIAAQKQKLTVEMAALSAGGLGGPGAPAGGMNPGAGHLTAPGPGTGTNGCPGG